MRGGRAVNHESGQRLGLDKQSQSPLGGAAGQPTHCCCCIVNTSYLLVSPPRYTEYNRYSGYCRAEMLVCIYPPSICVCRNKDSWIFVVRLNAGAARKLVRVQYLVSAAKSQHCEGGEAGGGWGEAGGHCPHQPNGPPITVILGLCSALLQPRVSRQGQAVTNLTLTASFDANTSTPASNGRAARQSRPRPPEIVPNFNIDVN